VAACVACEPPTWLACALCAVEEAFLAENLVLDAFALPFV
jgi:hypothetical protein